ncbi:hypothetical protein THAOC_28082 [Thalassiosira oceanica]|uniref:Uncharacterized protein n=1 Tax=Thalassiosira oceanica TaxID=159749 RepID=K0RK32_THAOC|nr:hypothetical protein THAOC_28082 [Thalassiosira oceanica]|eukprot:EJK52624.1 hypothetical protein THAOC_28082 [Thalassiosira oceanica]
MRRRRPSLATRSVGRSTSYRTVEFLRRGSVPTARGSHRKKVHLEEVPPSPYATPGEDTPAGSTPQGEFNWVKGRVRDLYHKVHELLGSGVADAQATASSAASTVAGALNASNPASSTASNALTLAKTASDQASSLAAGGGTPAGWSAPAAQQQQGAVTPADVDALRKEMMRAIERALVAFQADAYELLPGEVVAVFDDALKLSVAHLPNELMVDLLSPGYWETFDTPGGQSAITAASVAKDMKNQLGFGANKGVLNKMASVLQKWPQDLLGDRPTDRCFFSKVGDYAKMATGNESVYQRAVAKRNADIKDLAELRKERLALHPQAITLLQKLDNTMSSFLTWNQGQLQTLRDELLMKQCGSDMSLCTAEIEKEVWLVLSGIMWAVFEALHKLRSRARAMTDLGDATRFNATFLYTTCQECALPESIMKHQLKEWAPASAAIMQYLFTNSISLTLYRALEARVEVIEDKFEKAEKKDKVREGHITELQNRNGASPAFPPPNGPSRAPRPGLLVFATEDRRDRTRDAVRRIEVRQWRARAAGRRFRTKVMAPTAAERRNRAGGIGRPTGAHSGRREAERGYMMGPEDAGRREAVPTRDKDRRRWPDPPASAHVERVVDGAPGPRRGPSRSDGHHSRVPAESRQAREVRGAGRRPQPLAARPARPGFRGGGAAVSGQAVPRGSSGRGLREVSSLLPPVAIRGNIGRYGRSHMSFLLLSLGHWSTGPPQGWEARSLVLSHGELGGSTTAAWTLVAWYPPGHDAPPPIAPIQCPPQPHGPLSTWFGDGVWAEPLDHQPVECACRFSPTGFGRRVATSLEIAVLWDVSILVTDKLSAMTMFRGLVKALGATPPGKFLQFGADRLIRTEQLKKLGNDYTMRMYPDIFPTTFGVSSYAEGFEPRLITGGFRGGSSEGLVVDIVDRPGVAVDPEECEVKGSGDNEELPLAAPGVRFPSPTAMDRAPAPTVPGGVCVRGTPCGLEAGPRRLQALSAEVVETSEAGWDVSRVEARALPAAEVETVRHRIRGAVPGGRRSLQVKNEPGLEAQPRSGAADARDGQPHFLLGDFGGYVRPQTAPKPEDREKVLLKLLPARQRGYIEAGSGKVKSLINYFWVDKGETDIRIMYDGTGCGLNDFIWAMHFGLPTMRHTLRSLLPGYYQCDGDIGEMFLNFMLHEMLRELSGVSIQLMTRVKLVAYGDRRVRTNPFHWERVVFNLLGTSDYRPDLPWVMKVRFFDGHLACEVFVYVDDSRATGHSRWILWRAFRHFASVCTRHGIQIAERKSNFPSQVPQSWAGTNTDTSGGQVSATVSEKKWQKTKDCVRQLAELGLNNMINGWRPGYKDGWKLTGRAAREHERAQEEAEREGDSTSESHTMMFRRAHEEDLDEVVPVAVEPEAPATVEVFDRLRRDIRALLELTSSEDPSRRKIRSNEVLVALYLPGDASGQGFGSALIRREGVEYEAGVWRCEWRELSSNFREADNLVRRIEVLVRGGLRGAEIFVYTDNFVFESCYYKGYSKTSPELSDVILRLYKAAREGGLTIHVAVVWIAGTRMKEIGVDGLSRGDMLDGIMAGMDPLNLVRSRPEVQRGGDRVDPQLVEARPEPRLQEPMGRDSPRRGHQGQHVRAQGRRRFEAVGAPPGSHGDGPGDVRGGSGGPPVERARNHFWARAQHESLLIAVVLPLCHSPAHRGPWVLRGSEGAVDLARELERGFRLHSGRLSREQLSNMDPSVQEMWKDPERRSRTLLLQFLSSARKFPPVQECLVRGLLRGKFGGPVPPAPGGRARRRRPGGGRKRPAPRDAMTLTTIRWASLDALWAREPGTVQGNLSRAVRDHREAPGGHGRLLLGARRTTLPAKPRAKGQGGHDLGSLRPAGVPSGRAMHLERPVRNRPQVRDLDRQHVRGRRDLHGRSDDGDDGRSSDGGAVRVREPDAAQVVREVLVGRQAEDGTGQVSSQPSGTARPHDRRQGARAAGGAHVLRPHRIWRQPEGRGGSAGVSPRHAGLYLRPIQGGDGLQVALPSHQRSVRQQNPFQEVDPVPAAPAVGCSGPPGGLAVRQEGREDQGTDKGLRQGLHPLHGGPEGEPAGAVLGRHVDGALFPSSLDAPRGGPDDGGQGSEHDRQHDQPVADEGGRKRLRARPLDGANLHEHEGRHPSHDTVLEGPLDGGRRQDQTMGPRGEINDDLWTLPGPERNPFGGTLGDDGDPAGPAQVASCAGLAPSSWAPCHELGPLPFVRANVLGPGSLSLMD